jgi:hypothetical protein
VRLMVDVNFAELAFGNRVRTWAPWQQPLEHAVPGAELATTYVTTCYKTHGNSASGARSTLCLCPSCQSPSAGVISSGCIRAPGRRTHFNHGSRHRAGHVMICGDSDENESPQLQCPGSSNNTHGTHKKYRVIVVRGCARFENTKFTSNVKEGTFFVNDLF